MPLYRVKLVGGAFDKAQGQDVNVGFLESEERLEMETGEDGYILVRKRELNRLQQYGLVDDVEVDPAQQARTDEDVDDDPDHRQRRTSRTREHEGIVSAVHPGGAGHFPGDQYSNQRIQDEANADQAAGLAAQREKGLPTAREQQSEEALRSDHSLPEQEKAFRDAEQERDKELEKAQEKARKEREKAQREHERQEAKDQEKAQKEREERKVEGEQTQPVEPAQADAKDQEPAQDRSQEKVGAVKDSGDDSREGTKDGASKSTRKGR